MLHKSLILFRIQYTWIILDNPFFNPISIEKLEKNNLSRKNRDLEEGNTVEEKK